VDGVEGHRAGIRQRARRRDAGAGVLGRGVVDERRGAARGVGDVGRHAGDDAARDGAGRDDVGVALPVAEVVAVHAAGVASAAAPALLAAGAEVLEPRARAAAVLHAVDVVPGAVAEAGVVGTPPTTPERVGRARVDALVDGAAELGVAVVAEPAGAVGDVGVRRARRGGRDAARHRHGGTDHRRSHDEAAAARLLLEQPRGLLHEPVGDGDALAAAVGPTGAGHGSCIGHAITLLGRRPWSWAAP